MKQIYQSPIAVLQLIEAEDIIRTSLNVSDSGSGDVAVWDISINGVGIG